MVIAKHLEQSVATDLSVMQTSVDMNGKTGLIFVSVMYCNLVSVEVMRRSDF